MMRQLTLGMMIYPANFKEQLLHIEDHCADPLPFFNQDFAFCLVNLNPGEEEDEVAWSKFVQHVMYQQPGTMVVSEDDIAAMLQQMAEHRNNKLFVPEYATWIVRMSVAVKSLSRQSSFSCRRADIENERSGSRCTLFFTASNPVLLEDPCFDGLINLVRRRVRESAPVKPQKPSRVHRSVLTKSIRYEVFKRDGFHCRHCGATKEETTLHVDHILPVSRGGTDTMDNLQTLCEACNLSKSDRVFS